MKDDGRYLGIAAVLFLLLLGIHVGQSLLQNYRNNKRTGVSLRLGTFVFSVAPLSVVCCGVVKEIPRRSYNYLTAIWQGTLFLMACWWGQQQGVFSRDLISPVYLGLGLLGGHLVFGMSLIFTQGSWRDAADHFVGFGDLWDYLVENPHVLLRYVGVSMSEELIYRVAGQFLVIACFGNATYGILTVAVLFAIVHDHFFKNEIFQSVEFVAFAILLGALYYWTGSLALVVVIHAVRNIEISLLEHCIHVQNTGNVAQAEIEEEFLDGRRILVMLTLPGRHADLVCLEQVKDRDEWMSTRLLASIDNSVPV